MSRVFPPLRVVLTAIGLCGLWGSNPCQAEATLAQEIAPPAIHLGDTAKISISVTDGGWTRLLQLPKVDDLTVIRLGHEEVGGTPEHPTMISRFSVMPSRTGDFTIPAFDIKTQTNEILHTQPIILHVLDPGQNIPSQLLEQPATSPASTTNNPVTTSAPAYTPPAYKEIIVGAPDVSSLVSSLLQQAQSGVADAQCKLGKMYETGNGVIRDYAQALSWYQKAAAQGNAQAQCNLGVMYATAMGVPQDYAQALSWFQKAAAQGNALAQFSLGTLYDYGQGVPQDNAQALSWYQKAADQEEGGAQCNLGTMYYYGRGVAQDYAQALVWFHKAADRGNAIAQCNLGAMYHNGQGVSKDDNLAMEWFEKAAKQGNADAQNEIGKMSLEQQFQFK